MSGSISLNIYTFYLVALSLSVLSATMEVAASFREKDHRIRATVFNPWAFILYLWYCFLTLLVGQVLFEHEILTINWTGAIALGLLGPALFRTHVKLFQPISGKSGPSANLEKLITAIQSFCFYQINRDLSRERIQAKEKLLIKDPELLTRRLQILYSDEEYIKVAELIEERRKSGPDSLPALLVELIENKDPNALTMPFYHSSNSANTNL